MENSTKFSIGCAILAGGQSSRMHCNKALLKLDGSTYLQRIANELTRFGEKLLSTNDKSLADVIGFRQIPDVFLHCGPMGGIYSSLAAAQSDALFVVPCDLPYFTGRIADYLCQAITPTDLGVIAMDCTGRIQPLCAIYSKAVLPDLQQHLTDRKCKLLPFLQQPGFRIIEIPEQVASPVHFHNVNTPQDLP